MHPASAVILHSTNVVIHRSQYLNQIGKILSDLFVSLLLQGSDPVKIQTSYRSFPALLPSEANISNRARWRDEGERTISTFLQGLLLVEVSVHCRLYSKCICLQAKDSFMCVTVFVCMLIIQPSLSKAMSSNHTGFENKLPNYKSL